MKTVLSFSFLLLLCLLSIGGCSKKSSKIEEKVENLDSLKIERCGNFLEQYDERPTHLEFMACNKGTGQIHFEANYRVAGKHAASVEEFLVEKYGMDKLKFACCGWGNSRYGSFTNDGIVSMYSEETLLKDRNEWAQIPYFYVRVGIGTF